MSPTPSLTWLIDEIRRGDPTETAGNVLRLLLQKHLLQQERLAGTLGNQGGVTVEELLASFGEEFAAVELSVEEFGLAVDLLVELLEEQIDSQDLPNNWAVFALGGAEEARYADLFLELVLRYHKEPLAEGAVVNAMTALALFSSLGGAVEKARQAVLAAMDSPVPFVRAYARELDSG